MSRSFSRSLLTAEPVPVGCRTPSGCDAGQLRLARTREARHAAQPWWLWSNLLSLDAPAVASVWAVLFLRSMGARVPLAAILDLALAVWLIYATDRLLDGSLTRNRGLLRRRHAFCAEHRIAFLCAAGLAGGVLLVTGEEDLGRPVFRAGLLLGLLVCIYLYLIHGTIFRGGLRLPKEIIVGLVFAAGTSVPLWSLPVQAGVRAVVPCFLFASLCSLNCVSIECWETPQLAAWRRMRFSWVAWADCHLNAFAVAVASGALLANCVPGWPHAVLLSIGLAAGLTGLLNRWRKSLSPEALRVLADVALLVPGMLALAAMSCGMFR